MGGQGSLQEILLWDLMERWNRLENFHRFPIGRNRDWRDWTWKEFLGYSGVLRFNLWGSESLAVHSGRPVHTWCYIYFPCVMVIFSYTFNVIFLDQNYCPSSTEGRSPTPTTSS